MACITSVTASRVSSRSCWKFVGLLFTMCAGRESCSTRGFQCLAFYFVRLRGLDLPSPSLPDPLSPLDVQANANGMCSETYQNECIKPYLNVSCFDANSVFGHIFYFLWFLMLDQPAYMLERNCKTCEFQLLCEFQFLCDDQELAGMHTKSSAVTT